MNILMILEKQNRVTILMIGAILINVVGGIDFYVGYEISISVFYVLPIFIVTWFTGKPLGLLTSLICSLVQFAADRLSHHLYSQPLIPYLNTVTMLAFFLLTTILLAEFRKSSLRDAKLAHTDYLTGAINSRCFYPIAQREVDHLQRYHHPLTLAYIDLDHFKELNDSLGHTIGDQVLRSVVHIAEKHIRKTDVIARLGGDEFVILLPETGKAAAYLVLSRIHLSLTEEMQRQHWKITFSIGALTCITSPKTVKELIKHADELMYSVKRHGKNALKQAIYNE